jgi:hypothetical protein
MAILPALRRRYLSVPAARLGEIGALEVSSVDETSDARPRYNTRTPSSASPLARSGAIRACLVCVPEPRPSAIAGHPISDAVSWRPRAPYGVSRGGAAYHPMSSCGGPPAVWGALTNSRCVTKRCRPNTRSTRPWGSDRWHCSSTGQPPHRTWLLCKPRHTDRRSAVLGWGPTTM